MNKVILSLLLAVCVLGMALIMLNERLRKPEPATPPAGITEPAAPTDAPLAPPPAENMPANTTSQLQLPAQGQSPAPLNGIADTAAVHAPVPTVKSDPLPAQQSSAPAASTTPQPAVAKPAVPAKPAVAPAEKTAPAVEKTTKQTAQHRNITRFVVLVRDNGVTVRMVGAAPIAYKSMTLNGPERLVLDLDGKWQVKAPGVPKNSLVTNVRIGKADDKTRIVIDLSGKAKSKFTLSKDQQTLDIRLDH